MFPTETGDIETVFNFIVTAAKHLNNKKREAEAEKILQNSLGVLQRYNPLLRRSFLLKAIDIYYRTQQYDKAQAYCDKYLELFNFSGNCFENRDLIVGYTYLWCGKNKEAYECFERGVGSITGKGDYLRERSVHGDFGDVCFRLGRVEKAIELYQKCLEICVELGDKANEKVFHLNLSACYVTSGQYSLSISCAEKVLSLCEEIGSRSGEVAAYENLATAHQRLAEFIKAVEYLTKALYRYNEEGNSIGEGRTYAELGNIFIRTAQYQSAKECFEKSLGICSEGNSQSLKITSYQGLGSVYLRFGQRGKAIEFYEKSLALSLELGNDPQLENSYNCLAVVYENVGEYGKAIAHFQKGVELSLKSGKSTPEGYLGLGTVYTTLGKYDEAIEYLEKYLKDCLESGKPANRCYSRLGHIWIMKGQHEKAEEFFRKSLAISRKIADREEEANSLGGLGNLCGSTGDYRRGVLYVETALSINLEIGDRRSEGVNLGVLAIMYRELEQFEKAVDVCEKSLAIRLEVGDRLGEGWNYSSFGDIHRDLGDYEKAVKFDTMSYDIFVSLGHQSGVVVKCASLGEDCLGLNQPQKAIDHFSQGAALSQQLDDKQVIWMHGGIGRAYAVAQEFEKAECFLTKAIKESDDFLLGNFADEKRTWLSREYYRLYRPLAGCHWFHERHVDAFLTLDLGTAKALQILIGQRRNSKISEGAQNSYGDETWRQIEEGKQKQRLQDIARDLQLRENDTIVVVYTLAFLSQSTSFLIWILSADGDLKVRLCKVDGNATSAADWFMKATSDLYSNVQAVRLRRNCSFFGSSLSAPSSDVFDDETFQNCFPSTHQRFNCKGRQQNDAPSHSEHTIPETAHTNSQFSSESFRPAGPVSSGSISATDVPSAMPFIDDSSPGAPTTEGTAGNETKPTENDNSLLAAYSVPAYNALIDPVVDLIKGKKLIIVPDKMLFFTPFSMLMDKQGNYLSEKYSIQVTPSLHTLALSKQVPRPDKLGPALFIGNPAVGEVLLFGKPYKVA